jgi:hypothetical protein
MWGREAVTARYAFRADATHIVLPHGHFGALMDPTPAARTAAEQALGLEPCAVRIGIVGAPRREKQTGEFMAAFAASGRRDLQLLVLSLDAEDVPDDPRITARPYEFVARDEYNRRLAAVDVIALPFDPQGEMLTTGVVADVVGLGLPAIVSRWAYLTESLGPAGLVYEDYDHLVALLDSLTEDDLDRARTASIALQDELEWEHIAAQFLAAVIDAGAIKA